MKKKLVLLAGLVVAASISLASCTNNNNNNSADSKDIDLYVNYQDKQGISLIEDSFKNSIDGKTYLKGNLLPTWKTIGQKLSLNIRDASDYGSGDNEDQIYTLVKNNHYLDDKTHTNKIDLFYNSTENILKMGSAGEAVNLARYLDQMPNFKAYLETEEGQAVKKQISTADGKIFYTPCFEGFNDLDKTFVLDTQIVNKLLDDNSSTGDTTLSGKGGANNTLKEAKYTPFIDAEHNYPTLTTLIKVARKINGDYKAVDISVKQTTNIIKQQNDLLANGVTGRELLTQFKNYLAEAYNGCGYEKLSDIFCGLDAAYNCDELIALMRVVKANPVLLTNNFGEEIEVLIPRGQTNERVDNILDFACIWGVQGLTSRKDMLYFDANGKINDAMTTQATFDAVNELANLYSEGLICEDFYMSDAMNGASTYYLDSFWKNTTGTRTGFMMYDNISPTTAANDVKNGIGTDASKRLDSRKDESKTGYAPTISPVTYWGFGTDWNHSQGLRDLTGKVLTRYSDDSYALSSNSWCIPKSSDNLKGALKMMDYLWSDEGSRIVDFGPDDGKYWELGTISGVEGQTPIISSSAMKMFTETKKDFWEYSRSYLGTTHSIGHKCSRALDIQATNQYATDSYSNVKNAINLGILKLTKVGSTYNYLSSVPTNINTLSASGASSYASLVGFFDSNKCAKAPTGWVYLVVNGGSAVSNTTILGTAYVQYSLADVLNQMSKKNTTYLFDFGNTLDSSVIPDYAKA